MTTIGYILDEVKRIERAKYLLENADLDDCGIFISGELRNDLIELLEIHKDRLLNIKVKNEVTL